jgi:hypothetical protein
VHEPASIAAAFLYAIVDVSPACCCRLDGFMEGRARLPASGPHPATATRLPPPASGNKKSYIIHHKTNNRSHKNSFSKHKTLARRTASESSEKSRLDVSVKLSCELCGLLSKSSSTETSISGPSTSQLLYCTGLVRGHSEPLCFVRKTL